MKIRLLLTILLLTATIAANTQIMERTFLKKVLTKLEKIESATYYVTDESRQPDDSTTLFSSKEFELIAIESWSRQVSSIRNYANRKKLNDTILNVANEVIKQYQTSGCHTLLFHCRSRRTEVIVKRIPDKRNNPYNKRTTMSRLFTFLCLSLLFNLAQAQLPTP